MAIGQNLAAALTNVMDIAVQQIVEQEATAAAERVKERIRAEVGIAAIKVAHMYEVRDMTDRIVITVKQ